MSRAPSETSFAARRQLFMVLSPRSLGYARLALQSLWERVSEPVHLSLITDSVSDKQEIMIVVSGLLCAGAHTWSVSSAADLDEREEAVFAGYEYLRGFRRGHPCWRKITDPLLLSDKDQEMILLDPDIYFPNHFRFEQSSPGLFLMWQRPCCLLPSEVVQAAFRSNVRLAHHVDIGVAQWRQPVDLEWLNWLIGAIEAHRFSHSMHVEAVVWAAIAMRIGGGYLDRTRWLCWHRTQYNRILRKLGVPGTSILHREDLSHVKCFHAGGEAKWWLTDAFTPDLLDHRGHQVNPSLVTPFAELTRSEYVQLERNRRWLRRLGYYAIFSP